MRFAVTASLVAATLLAPSSLASELSAASPSLHGGAPFTATIREGGRIVTVLNTGTNALVEVEIHPSNFSISKAGGNGLKCSLAKSAASHPAALCTTKLAPEARVSVNLTTHGASMPGAEITVKDSAGTTYGAAINET